MVRPPPRRATAPPVDGPPGQTYDEHLPKITGCTFVLFHWLTPLTGFCSLVLCIARLVHGNTPSSGGFRPFEDVVYGPAPRTRSRCTGISPLSNSLNRFPVLDTFPRLIPLFSHGSPPVPDELRPSTINYILLKWVPPVINELRPYSHGSHPHSERLRPFTLDDSLDRGLPSCAYGFPSSPRRLYAVLQWLTRFCND